MIKKICITTFCLFWGGASFAYYPGQTKNHGHTAAIGDGGPLTNPIITTGNIQTVLSTAAVIKNVTVASTLTVQGSATFSSTAPTVVPILIATNSVTMNNINGTSVSGYRNRIPNPEFLDGNFYGSPSTGNIQAQNLYVAMNWRYTGSGTGGIIYSSETSVSPPTGFSNYEEINIASTYTATPLYCLLRNEITGYAIRDFKFGTSSASSIALSFCVRLNGGVNLPASGTYSGSIQSISDSRSYAFNYTIPSTGTWNKITVNIPGDTVAGAATGGTGTIWDTLTSTGLAAVQMYVTFALGTTASTGTLNAWNAGASYMSNNSLFLSSVTGAKFDITGVQLEIGSTTAFEYATTVEALDKMNGTTSTFYSSTTAAGKLFGTSAQWGDMVSLTLPTAGDYDCALTVLSSANGATVTDFEIGISQTTGNSATGLVLGDNWIDAGNPTASSDYPAFLPRVRVLLSQSASTIIYAKIKAAYSVATPKALGSLRCRRWPN